MKKVLLLAVLAVSMTMTTGCAHKKRVQALEEELLRCKERRAQLSENVDHHIATDGELASASALAREEPCYRPL